MDYLRIMRARRGPVLTTGLADDIISRFIVTDINLSSAISQAFDAWKALDADTTYGMAESHLIESIYSGWCNFYTKDSRNPFVPIAAAGPWVITTHGAVIHDDGGYGMLGLGHNPPQVLQALANPQVMANIMTPSLHQRELISMLRKEIGHTRSSCPYAEFLMMNSGSEGNSVADRIIDVHTGNKRGARDRVIGISLVGSFHGRTFKPAVWTDSNAIKYAESKCHALSSYKAGYCRTVSVNDCDALIDAFANASKAGEYIEAVFMEAVMGEGRPGQPISPAFYEVARKLTTENESLLLVDSVQAGFRCQGCLSIMDYPGFSNLPAPDFEVFSKALNAGQYPLSVVALSKYASEFYRQGIYGNTMTANPRACAVACQVLCQIPALRTNIINAGLEALQKLKILQSKFPTAITAVTGTGLLYAIHLDKKRFPVVAVDGVEFWLRTQGLGVVHGGENALRFTPHFSITSDEIDLQVSMVEKFLLRAPVALESLAAPISNTQGNFERSIKMRGHLFDTNLVNDALHIVETFTALARFENLRLGATKADETELTLVFSATESSAVETLAETLRQLTVSRNCYCS